MLDLTVHLGDLIVAGGVIVSGWTFSVAVRDRMRGIEMTVYGSSKPPVVGLVNVVRDHSEWLARHGYERRHDTRRTQPPFNPSDGPEGEPT
ncbi:MAG TPA: hypothetical protein VK504_25135 [Vicinamibacterales bacterium]|jgi:hypothetical protein|nr:hypothetical protein [Vicinamibacterales bacterium]